MRHIARSHAKQNLRIWWCEEFGAQSGVGGRPPMCNLCAAHNCQRTSVGSIEQNTDSLYRRDFPFSEISGEAGEHFRRKVTAVISSASDDVLLLFVPKISIQNVNFRSAMRGF